jgi:hypothetical protein
MLEGQQQHRAAMEVRREAPNQGFLVSGKEAIFKGFLRLAAFIK